MWRWNTVQNNRYKWIERVLEDTETRYEIKDRNNTAYHNIQFSEFRPYKYEVDEYAYFISKRIKEFIKVVVVEKINQHL